MNVRPFGDADLEAVAALLRADEEHTHGRPSQVGAADLREWTSRANLAEDSWLFEQDGALRAAGWVDIVDDLGVGIGVVHPEWKGTGLGAQLVDRSEATARTRGAARMHQFALGADVAAAALMTARGYRDVRHFFEMAIEQSDPPPPVELPVEPVRDEDLRAFHHALDEAFQDHWEHHSSPFDEWWARHSSNPNFDLSLWFLIRDGDEIAAVTRNQGNRNGGGYIDAIGVRRAWRGQGYAKALLLHSFRVFFERGMPRVTLGVDAENPTGATHLYERVGMHVEQENVVFEKELQ
ncbi:MAG TPA: GNAT family N-acetyltransferase [Gaiellaceae bacterium]|jgi:ribosomal protein S18 acetylase RimI-like enzyme